MLDKCLEVSRVYFFSEYDLHVLPGVKRPLWGVGGILYFFPFIFCGVGDREGIEVLQFWNS